MTAPTLTPDITAFASKSLFGHLIHGVSNPSRVAGALCLATLLATSILAVNAVWVITGSSGTLLTGWMSGYAPLETWLLAIGIAFGGVVALSFLIGQRPLRVLVCLLTAWLVGVFIVRTVGEWISWPDADFPFQDYGDAAAAFVYRLTFLAPVLFIIVAYLIVERGDRAYPLRFGNILKKTTLFSGGGKQISWLGWVVRLYIFFFLPFFLLFQWQAGFEPLTSGKWLVFLPVIILLAAMNATSEDLVFQGFFLPAQARMLGAGLGIFTHALFFGFMHWGASPGVVAGLASALVICFLVWIASKAAIETRGIGVSILIHMGADIVVFSAIFI